MGYCLPDSLSCFASFWSTRDATNYSETIQPGEECPMLPSSEVPGPLPKMRCHDPACQEYLFNSSSGNLNATMEKQCYITENKSSWTK